MIHEGRRWKYVHCAFSPTVPMVVALRNSELLFMEWEKTCSGNQLASEWLSGSTIDVDSLVGRAENPKIVFY